MVSISNEWHVFSSHFTDEGVWQEELIVRNVEFTALSLPLQALLIAELANYGDAQELRFTFPDGMGVLTIGSGAFGPRVITVSNDRLNALKTALEVWPIANHDGAWLFESAKSTQTRLKSGASLLKNA